MKATSKVANVTKATSKVATKSTKVAVAKVANPVIEALKAQLVAARIEGKRLIAERKAIQLASASERKVKADARKVERAARTEAVAARKVAAEAKKIERIATQAAKSEAKVARDSAVTLKLEQKLAKAKDWASAQAVKNQLKAATQRGLAKAKSAVRKPGAVEVIVG